MVLAIDNKKKVKCEYCNSENNDFIANRKHSNVFSISRKDTFGIYKCNSCRLFFSFPKPELNDLKKFFLKEYHSVRYNKSLEKVLEYYPARITIKQSSVFLYLKKIIKKIWRNFHCSRYLDIEEIIDKNLKDYSKNKINVLEIGPGTAPLLYLEVKGYNYIGVEPAKQVVDIFNRKGYKNIVQGFGENMDFITERSIGAIIFIGTLSHVFDIKKVLKECRRVLVDNGLMLIVDCNADTNVIENIGGSYTNYGFTKDFLSKSITGFKLIDYFYIDAQKKIDSNGIKVSAVLKKEKDLG